MTNQVKIIECPRDAWQGLPAIILAERKAAYLTSLIAADFTHIDAVSFVSPSAVPQMADSEAVLQCVKTKPGVEIIGIVVNERGAARAIETGAVQTLGFPFSISPEFLHRNQRQTPEESLAILTSIAREARRAGLNVVAYISMAFGNPYGDAWSLTVISDACRQLIDAGATQISLADTVGLASPSQIGEVAGSAIATCGDLELGVHLHARRSDASAKIRAAYNAGCRRFDSAIGGLGGCPFAQDELVGNVPTELLIAELASLGAVLPTLAAFDELLHANAAIAAEFASRPAMNAAPGGTH